MTLHTVAVIGLGAMGLGMATTLAGKAFSVRGFDLSLERVGGAQKAGIATDSSALEAVADVDFAVLSLPNGAVVRSTVGEWLTMLEARRDRPLIIIDTSTSDAQTSRDLAALLAGIGHGFIDAPVSGGPGGAAEGALTMMLGGDEKIIGAARPVLEALSAKSFHVGDSGAGNVAKLANNLLAAAHLITVSEALRLAQAAGVDPVAVLRVINAASGRAAISEVHFPRWVTSGRFDSGFSMALMRKDVRLAMALADDFALDLPLSHEVASLWQNSIWDDSDDFTRMGSYLPNGNKEHQHD
jgi:3-hydroxyisobutyrate dehydrogenase